MGASKQSLVHIVVSVATVVPPISKINEATRNNAIMAALAKKTHLLTPKAEAT